MLFLFLDTGGGHRSAAEAINLDFQNRISTEMVNFFKAYAPPPFDLAFNLYSPMVKVPDVWKFGYKLSDDPQRTRFLFNVMWPYIQRATYRLLNDHP